MIGQPNITEKVILFLSDVTDAMDYPKSFSQLLSWDKHQYYKNRDRLKAKEKRERARILKAIKRLEKAEVITFNKKQEKYKLTPSGWLKFLHYYNKNRSKKPSREGIEKYFIIFDIPEEHRYFRDLFRQCLVNLGCRFEQKSVFQTADLEVFKFAQQIVANCDLDDHVKFIEAKRVY